MSGAAEIVSAVSNSAVALIAGVALWAAWKQIRLAREMAALDAYEKYHEMCLQHAGFASSNVKFSRFSQEELEKYKVFVLYTLLVCERIYALFPKDEAWAFSIKDDIRMHKDFIKSEHFKEHLDGQGWHVRPLIEQVLSET